MHKCGVVGLERLESPPRQIDFDRFIRLQRVSINLRVREQNLIVEVDGVANRLTRDLDRSNRTIGRQRCQPAAARRLVELQPQRIAAVLIRRTQHQTRLTGLNRLDCG